MLVGKIGLFLSNIKTGLRSFVPIIILIIFTLIGAVMFMSIEGPYEKYELEKLKHERERLLEVI